MRLKYYFHNDEKTENPDSIEDRDTKNENILYPSSGWTPQLGKDPYWDT